jgi:predicted dehydrogenase
MELLGLITSESDLGDVDRARLSKVFGLRHFDIDFSASWFQDEVEVAVIGTPPESHYELVLSCLSLGKHVLVEKPFAMSSEQAVEMIRVARSADLQLGVVHNFQFLRSCRRARKIFESGELGELRGLIGFQSSNHRRRLPRWYKSLPLGLFTDESPHLIYLLLSFLPGAEPKSIFVGPSVSDKDNTPQLVSGHFESPDGLLGSLHMSFVGALSEWQLVLLGSKRTLVVDLFRDILLDVPDDRRHESLDVLQTSMKAVMGHAAGFVSSGIRHVTGTLDYGNGEVFRRFVTAVVDGAPPEGVGSEDGAAVVRVMERINQEAAP